MKNFFSCGGFSLFLPVGKTPQNAFEKHRQARKRETVSMGEVDLSINHEGCSHYATLLFLNFIVILDRYCKSLFWIPLFNILLVFYIY